jgi:hypothetical protein
MDPLDDQTVAVGDELVIELRASSSGEVDYSYRPDLGAVIAQRPDGSGLFRWRPSAGHVGQRVVDFHARDDTGVATESIRIEVRPAVGAAPVFRRPLGAGTAIGEGCVELEVAVSDEDSALVVIAEEEPRIEGAELAPAGELAAWWRWCPTAAQRQLADRYLLTLSADDRDHPRAIKRYQIVLRDPAGCDRPVIEHQAPDRAPAGDLEVLARVRSTVGLAAAPRLYWSSAPVAAPLDLRRLDEAPMRLASGDRRDGVWGATLPDPSAGAAANLFYLLVAEDGGGDCDHIAVESFQVVVATPGGSG